MTFSDISGFKPRVNHEYQQKLKTFLKNMNNDDWMIRRNYDEESGLFALIIISAKLNSIPLLFPNKELADACYDYLIKQ